MNLDDNDSLIGVLTCTEAEDVLLVTDNGRCVRFAVTDIRVFQSRNSRGVRGIRLGEQSRVVSVALLNHVDLDVETRDAYLRQSRSRNLTGPDDVTAPVGDSLPEFDDLAANEQMILTVTGNGFGKRSSAYEYRVTRRGGQGIVNIATSERNGDVVASFPVSDGDEVMLVTDGGKIIRSPVNDIRISGRNTQGVTLFTMSNGQKVVSVARLEDGQTADVDPSGDGTKQELR